MPSRHDVGMEPIWGAVSAVTGGGIEQGLGLVDGQGLGWLVPVVMGTAVSV